MTDLDDIERRIRDVLGLEPSAPIERLERIPVPASPTGSGLASAAKQAALTASDPARSITGEEPDYVAALREEPDTTPAEFGQELGFEVRFSDALPGVVRIAGDAPIEVLFGRFASLSSDCDVGVDARLAPAVIRCLAEPITLLLVTRHELRLMRTSGVSALDALVVRPSPEVVLPQPATLLAGFVRSEALNARLRDKSTSPLDGLTALGLCARFHGPPVGGDSQAYLAALHAKDTPSDRVEAALRALSEDALRELVTAAQLAAGQLGDDLDAVERAFAVSDEAAAGALDDLCLRRDDLESARIALGLVGAGGPLSALLEDVDEEAETHGLTFREAARLVKADARHHEIAAEEDGWWAILGR